MSSSHTQQFWNSSENTAPHQTQNSAAAYWSYAQQAPPSQPAQMNYVDSPWNQLGGYNWNYLATNQPTTGHVPQQQTGQTTSSQPNAAYYYDSWSQYNNNAANYAHSTQQNAQQTQQYHHNYQQQQQPELPPQPNLTNYFTSSWDNVGYENSFLPTSPQNVQQQVQQQQQQQQPDLLEHVCLDDNIAEEQENRSSPANVGLVDTVSKWGKSIVNSLAPDVDNNYDEKMEADDAVQANFATLSFAGMAHQPPPLAVPTTRSRSSSTVSATSPKLGFSELLTYSYYEADVSRRSASNPPPPVAENAEISEQHEIKRESVDENPVSGEEQLPEADKTQFENSSFNYESKDSNRLEMEALADNSISSATTVWENVETQPREFESPPEAHSVDVFRENSSTMPKNGEQEENWSMIENFDAQSKQDLGSINNNNKMNTTYNSSLASWSQWGEEEDDDEENESPENFETHDVTDNRGVSDWRPESERDDQIVLEAAVVGDVHGESQHERQAMHSDLFSAKGFGITVNEPVNLPPEARSEVVSDLHVEAVAHSSFNTAEERIVMTEDRLYVVSNVEENVGELPGDESVVAVTVDADDRREMASMWSAVSNVDDKSVRDLPEDESVIAVNDEKKCSSTDDDEEQSVQELPEDEIAEKRENKSYAVEQKIIPSELLALKESIAAIEERRDKASLWSAVSNVDEKSVREMPDDVESTLTKGNAPPASNASTNGRNSPPPAKVVEPVCDSLLIDRFLRDAHQIVEANDSQKVVVPKPLRRDDSSVWSTIANPEIEHTVAAVIQPAKVSPVKQHVSATVSKKVESVSSQGSSVLSLSRKTTQSFAPQNKDPENRQGDNLSKKRRESLHKRYKEATKKSQEIFARLNVSLLSTSLEPSMAGKHPGLFLLPSSVEISSAQESPQPSPGKPIFKAIKGKSSTPVQNKEEDSAINDVDEKKPPRRIVGDERRRSAEMERRESDLERRRDSDLERRRESDTERHRDYEHGFRRRPYSRSSEQADWRYDSYNDPRDYEQRNWKNGRRPYSRASERGDDWRYQKPEGNFKNRPHSTQGFDSDEDSEDYEDDEIRDYHRAWRRYQSEYGRHRMPAYGNWGVPHSRSMYNHQSMDPGWQKYLYEFYSIHGYYPTYEQLHRMWADQYAATGANAAANVPKSSTSSKNRVPKSATADKIATVAAVGTAAVLKRTEAYVANQRQQLFSDEKESEPSVSRADSDRSFDVPSSISAVEAYHLQVPHKHSIAHAVCRFGVGGHLTIVTGGNRASGQRQTVVEIRHVRNMIKNDVELEEWVEKMESFSGPLSPAHTDKSALIQFCQRMADKYRHDLSVMDRESAVLVWHLFVSLIRQNGTMVGSDLARLLVDGREFVSSNVAEVEKHAAPRHSDQEDDEYVDVYDRSYISAATQTTDRVEQHFRELLLGGSKKEALEWAIKHKLWGHALFLAMKIDQRTHTNVMIRFANSLVLNDPLQTLYQMMSGVMPYASTQMPDEKWGDWRPHLAIILSNLSLLNGVAVDQQAFEREMMSVLTLGNTLMDDGRTFAAHFCYLCCHLLGGWDIFSVRQSRQYVSLIGAHSELRENDIYSIDRIHMTEIYEYAVGLLYAQAKQTFCLPTIQIYKLRYALQLAELGFAEDAYKYCCTLNAAVQQTPNLYSYSMVSVIVDLASRLQKFDSTMEHLNFGRQFNDQPMTQWILDLNLIARGLREGTIAPIGYQQNQQQQEQVHAATARHPSTSSALVDEQPKKRFSIGQPEDQENETVTLVTNEESRQSATPVVDSRRNSMQQYSSVVEHDQRNRRTSSSVASSPRHSSSREPYGGVIHAENYVEYSENSPQQLLAPREHHRSYAEVVAPVPNVVDQQSTTQQYAHENDFYDLMAFSTTTTTGQVGQSLVADTPPNVNKTVYTSRNFTSTSTEGGVSDNVFTPSPRTAHEASPAATNVASSVPQRLKAEPKLDANKRTSSWIGKHLGGALRKILPKDANEMILPEDKNKSIVWDKATGRWMNTDKDDVDDTPPPPPPSLANSGVNFQPVSDPLPAVTKQEVQNTMSREAASQNRFPDAAVAVPKPTTNRFASQGKRYASIDAFGGSTSAATASSSGTAPPPLPMPVAGPSVPVKKSYFVPTAMNNVDSPADPFSAPDPNQQQAAGVQQRQ